MKAVELADLESDEERGVYELITRHFLACCAQDAKGSQTKIKVEIPLGGEVEYQHTYTHKIHFDFMKQRMH